MLVCLSWVLKEQYIGIQKQSKSNEEKKHLVTMIVPRTMTPIVKIIEK